MLRINYRSINLDGQSIKSFYINEKRNKKKTMARKHETYLNQIFDKPIFSQL